MDSIKVLSMDENQNDSRTGLYISVIIPCYNVERYVGRCLDSIVNQTIGLEHLQLILVDDASTDQTLDILQEMEGKYPDNIVLIPLPENAGQGRARNIAMEYAAADYITFIDADDWLNLHTYEWLYEEAQKDDYDFLMFDMERAAWYVKPVLYPVQRKNIETICLSDDKLKEEFLVKYRENIMCWNKLFKKEFLQRNDIYFFEGKKFEDHYFGMLALLYSEKILHLKHKCYHWFQNPESTCLSGKNILDRIDVQLNLYQECIRRGFAEKYKDILQYNLFEKMVLETSFYLKKEGEDTTLVLQDLMKELSALGIDIRMNPYYKMSLSAQKEASPK